MVALPKPQSATVEAIYKSYEGRQDSGFRRHLGASIIGTECLRSLWYSHRWATKAQHAGRLLRLFQSGHLAEARFIADLRAIGVTVMDVDPDNGRQWSFSAVRKHFGGSADGIALGFPEAPSKWHILELKTHSAKSFADLEKKGVQESKPLHYCQVQVYMSLAGLDRAFYLAVCKDTDALYGERIHADPDLAKRLLAKAETVINSPRPPPRAYNSESFFLCRFCSHHAVCWQGELPERHCRSCMNSTPADDGAWHCAAHGGLIEPRMEATGCEDKFRYHPDMVHGEVIEATEHFIKYKKPDGTIWVDGIP